MPKILTLSKVLGTATDKNMTVTLLSDGLQIQRGGTSPVLWNMAELDRMYSNALYRSEPAKEAKLAPIVPVKPKVKTLPYGLTVAIHHSFTTKAKKDLTAGWRTRPMGTLGMAILMAEATGAKATMCDTGCAKWIKETAMASGGFDQKSPGSGRKIQITPAEAELVLDFYKQRLAIAAKSRSETGKRHIPLALAARGKGRQQVGAPEVLVAP